MTRFFGARRGQHRGGLLLGAAAVFGVTLMIEQNTKPSLVARRSGIVGV